MVTIKDYYDKIIQVKDGKTELDELAPFNDHVANLIDDLNSGSKVAIWRLWVWIMATLAWMQGESLEKHKIEIENQIKKNGYGTIPFYHAKSLSFQFGYSLSWNGKQYVYSTIDVTSKVINRSSVSMLQGILRFKVAKESGGVLSPLTTPEETAFKDYLNNIIYPGTNYTVITSVADLLRLILKIFINPQVIDFNGIDHLSGELVVEKTINNFCQNLPFDGKMNLLKLIDELQEINGVEDISLIESSYKYGSIDWIVFTRQIVPFSGHMNLDSVNSNITYHEYI